MYSISELVQLSKQDKRYMETLWIVLEKRCIRWAKKVQRIEGDWEDLYQEAYFVLTKTVEEYKTEKNIQFEAYFMLALNNKANDYYRKLGSKQEKEFKPEKTEEGIDWYADLEDPNCNPERDALDKIEVLNLLKKLPDTEKYIIEAFYLKEVSMEKISKDLGLSYHAIDAKKRRALKKLKKIKKS